MNGYKTEGEALLAALINQMIKSQQHFDYINGVLTSRKALGNVSLWFWFGELKIVEPGDEKKLAGQMKILNRYETMDNGFIVLYPRGE